MNTAQQSSFTYKNGALYCENVALESVAEQFGTPLYVYSGAQLRANIRGIGATLAGNSPHHRLSYAFKANANMELLRIIQKENTGADVVSAGELALARHIGFPQDTITYAGAGKRDEEIIRGIEENILAFDVESAEELTVINSLAEKLEKKAHISIRVNPDVDAQSHPYITTGLAHNKFGIPIGEAFELYKSAATMRHVKIAGLHSHIGSQISTVVPFIEAAKSIVSFVEKLQKENIPLHHVNIGGGIGVEYHNAVRHPALPHVSQEKIPTPDEYLNAVLPIIGETGAPIIIEPGRALVANTGVLLTRVLYTKHNPVKHFTIVDAGMNDLIRPCLYSAYHQIVPTRITTEETTKTDVVGPVCESADFLARDRVMPRATRGDVLAVMTTGAYGYALASNYNMRPRPAEILIEGNQCICIRERETLFTFSY